MLDVVSNARVLQADHILFSELALVALAPCSQVLDMLTGQVQDQCSHLIEACTTAQSGLQAFDFLGNSVLAAVDQQVAEAMPGTHSHTVLGACAVSGLFKQAQTKLKHKHCITAAYLTSAATYLRTHVKGANPCHVQH